MIHRIDPIDRRLNKMLGYVMSAVVVMAIAAGAWAAAPAAPAAPAAAPAAKPAVHALPVAPADKINNAPAPASVIKTFIPTEAALLQHPDSKEQAKARNLLVSAVVVGQNQVLSAPYAADYAKALNAALVPVFKNPDMRIRLNAGIVIERVASQVNNDRLGQAAAAAANDRLEPIALWGVKAAKYIIPFQLIVPVQVRDKTLIEAVKHAALTFPASGALIEEAYEALAGARITGQQAVPDIKPQIVADVVALMKGRVEQYRKVNVTNIGADGNPTGLPPSPATDNKGLVFVSTVGWPAGPQAQAVKQQIGQAIVEMLTELIRVAPTVQPRPGPSAPTDVVWKDDLLTLIKNAGAAAGVIINKEKAADPAKTADAVRQIGPDTPENQMTDRVNALAEVLRGGNLLAPNPAAPTAPAGGPAAAR